MTNNQPKVSVIIPIYNVEQYLSKCLDSIINQTYKNLEIICINDGSPDNSLAILEEYAKKDSRIIIINQGNAGVSTARNRGLDIATGEYISFVDPDDWIESNTYESTVNLFEKNPKVDLITFGTNIINERDYNNKETLSLKWYFSNKIDGICSPTRQMINSMPGSLCKLLLRTSKIQKLNLRFFDTTLGEDLLFLMEYLSDTEYIYSTKKSFYNYVLHSHSATNTFDSKYNALNALQTYSQLIIEAHKFYTSQNKYKLFNDIIFYRLFNNIVYSMQHLSPADRKDALTILSQLSNTLPEEYDWGEVIKNIRNKECYRIEQLNIPWLVKGNRNFGFEIYKYEEPKIIIYLFNLKLSLHYQKLLSVKNINNRKVFNILGLKIKVSKQKKFSEYLKKLLRKIFSIYNEYKNNKKYKIINILGIKIKHSIDIDQLANKFAKKNNKYLDPKASKIKQRLFVTTGNLSLVNNLTIIKQLNEPNCEDTLIILSHIVNNNFFSCCKEIAKIHPFKNIYTICTKGSDLREFIIRKKLSKIDEVYFSNQYQFIYTVNVLYPNAKWIITDEGCGSKLARSAYLNYDRVDKIIMHNYLDKLDFFGLSKENMNKIVPINKQIFDNVCQECAQKFSVNLNLYNDEKAIVFCGSWWEVTGLSKDAYMKLQDSIIERLTNMGYTILFKTHPRDPRNYINNPNIKILNTTLPLECYKLDIVAVISMGSSASLHSPYISNVAGFSIDLPIDWENPLEQKWLDLLVKKLIKEYTTPIEELFSVNPKLYSKEELKQILLKKCMDFINSKPLLSQNKELENFALSKEYKFNYKEINDENSSYSRI